jgi:hypothetical protein
MDVRDVQIHGQLPPPLVWCGSLLVLTLSAFGEDRTGRNIRSDRLPSNGNILLHRLHPTLLQNILQPRVNPHITTSAIGLVLLGHPICSSNVKSFEPREGGPRDNPCLTAVEEDGLEDSLVELRGYEQRGVLAPKDLTHASPKYHGLSAAVLKWLGYHHHPLPSSAQDTSTVQHVRGHPRVP